MKIHKISTNKRLVIMRGISGSGKSTLAKEIAKDGGVICSSDDFFTVNGKYLFDPAALGYAHAWCQRKASKYMASGTSVVVIDNTNVNWKAVQPYVALASQYGYSVEYAEPNTPWKFDAKELARRNTHRVPEAAIQKMIDNWQPTETLGMEKKASSNIDLTGFWKSNRLTSEEQELFNILLKVVGKRTAGTTVRAVGGWVRDKLLGTQPKDIDLMVDNIGGAEFARLVTEELGLSGPHVIRSNPEQSKNIETARVYIPLSSGKTLEIDVAKARQDVYSGDSRIPVTTEATAEDDSYRRDLTINCLFYNINNDTVEDFTGMGAEDLQHHVIRTPLDPVKTFSDDPLRMMRAIRFAARYGWDVAPEVRSALSSPDLRDKLKKKVSRERKGIEIKDMLSKGHPEVAVELLIDTGIFEDLLRDATAASGRDKRLSSPDMNQNSKYHDLSWGEHTKALARGVARKYRGQDPEKVFMVMMTAMLHDIGKLDSSSRQDKEDGTTSYHGHADVSREAASEFMRFVKLESYSKPVESLVGAHMRPHQLSRYDSNKTALRRFIRQMTEMGIDWKDVVNIAMSDASAKGKAPSDEELEGYVKMMSDGEIAAQDIPLQKGKGVKPILDGKEIMQAFNLKPGPEIGKILAEVLSLMDDNPSISKEEAIERIKTLRSGDNWLDKATAVS